MTEKKGGFFFPPIETRKPCEDAVKVAGNELSTGTVVEKKKAFVRF